MIKMKRQFLHFLAGIGLLASSGLAETLCGTLNMPTTLTKSKSPYYVSGDLFVPSASRLTIEAGVELLISRSDTCRRVEQLDWADSQFVSIKVYGALYIKGSADQPVIIHPEGSKANKTSWDGIRIQKQKPSSAHIQFLQISGAHKALNISQSEFAVRNSLFEGNNTGIWVSQFANPSLENNVFAKNSSAGIFVQGAAPRITANIFVDNVTYGIWADSRKGLDIRWNLFWNNGESSCYHCAVQVLKLSQVNARGDSVDTYGNLLADPIFIDSPSEVRRKSRDPAYSTPKSQVLDTTVYTMHRKQDSLGQAGLGPRGQFVPIGMGPWRLSQYSPALDAGPESKDFLDANETRGDIGMWGGLKRYQIAD